MSSSPRTQSRSALAKCFLANAGRPDKEVLGFLADHALSVKQCGNLEIGLRPRRRRRKYFWIRRKHARRIP